jgi:hypothetical protein
MNPPRLLPDEPLPPYTFVPGRSPHPVSDPAGHSYGVAQELAPSPDPDRWPECRPYLRGLDLFNHGFYWEAHEAWEGLWHAAGRNGPAADFLKGLIQLAVAGVKHRQGLPEAIRPHARRARQLLREAAGGRARFFGLGMAGLIELVQVIGRDGWPADAPLLAPAE